MSLSYWNAQFQFAETIPDFLPRIASIRALSADNDQYYPWDVVSYGKDTRQCFLHQQTESKGAIRPVFIHGGFWRAQNAATFTATSVGLETLGTPVSHIEYRLMPINRLADLVLDIAHALASIIAQNPQDTRSLLLVGHSAGAHLALEALYHHHEIIGSDTAYAAHVVAISGIYDLRPVSLSFLQDEINLTTSEMQQFSPLDRPLYNPNRVMLVVGGIETPEMMRQAQFLSASQNVKLRILPDQDHLSVLDGLYSRETGFLRAINEHILHQQ